MNQEKFGVRDWILSNGPHWQKEDWGKFLNIDVIECNPYRLSRPLSNFIEVVDSKWRASLWEHITPHPALSLQWPFMFILLPWLLYQTFVNMGCFPFVALTGVCVYIASVGFLGPLVMMFHPAKNLVNFFGSLSLYFFSLKYKMLPDLPKKGGGAYIAGYVAMFFAFFSDETGLYVYVIALLLFYPLWLRLWRQKSYGVLSGLLVLPLMYAIMIKYFLPYLHWIVRGVRIHLNSYESFPSLKSLFWPDWQFLWMNARFLFADYPHLLINYKQLSTYPVIFSIQILYVLTVFFILLLFFRSLTKNRVQREIYLIGIGILLMIGYCFFQTFQLSQNAKAWGVWWYGCLFSLIFIFPLIFTLQIVYARYQWLCKWSAVIAFILVLNGLTFSTYHIAVFKLQNLNQTAYSFIDIFKGEVDPYDKFRFHGALERSHCKWMYAHLYWLRWKNLPDDVDPAQKDKCFSGPLASDLYFITEEDNYLPSELH